MDNVLTAEPGSIRSIAKIAAALAKAQSKMVQPEKNKTVTVKTNTGQTYSFDYADYSAIVQAVVGPLSENGIAFTHLVLNESGRLSLVTKLIHSSGEELETFYPLPATSDPKVFGGAMTYGKRYSLSAITGCVADDDADAEPEHTTSFKDRSPSPARPQPSSAASPVKPVQTEPAPARKASGPPTDAQKARLFTIAAERAWSKEQIKLCMDAHWGIQSTSHLTQSQYDHLVRMIETLSYSQAVVSKVGSKIKSDEQSG